MNHPKKFNFTPTSMQIRVAEDLFAAMAHEQTIRPIVEAYEHAILVQHQFHIAKKWIELGMEDQVILDRKRSYLMDDLDSAVWQAACFKARDASGLQVSHPENCPLLEAEHVRIDCENLLLQVMAKTPGLEHLARVNSVTMELRAKAVDLSLNLLAPFVKDANTILGRIMTEPVAADPIAA